MISYIERYSFLGFLAGFLLSTIETFDRVFLYGHMNFGMTEIIRFYIYDFSTVTLLSIVSGALVGVFVWMSNSLARRVHSSLFADKYSFEQFEMKFYLISGSTIGGVGLVAFNFIFKSSKDNSTFFTALFKLFQNSNTYATLRSSLLEVPFIANARLFFRETFNLEIGVILILLTILIVFVILFLIVKFLLKTFSDYLTLKNPVFQKIVLGIAFLFILVLYYVDSYFYRNLYHVLHTSLKFLYLIISLVFLTLLTEWVVPKSFSIKKRIFIPLVLLLTVLSNFDIQSNRNVKAAIFRHTELVRFSIQKIQNISDFDGDGYSSLFDGGDSEPMNSQINPRVAEIIGNGLDENSLGGDLVVQNHPKIDFTDDMENFFADSLFIPSEIKNVILLHVDALRNDRVLYGEYDYLLPNYKQFAKESMHFTRAYAQGSGTRASIHPMRAMTYNRFRDVDFNSIRPRLEVFKETLDTIVSKIPFELLDYESSPTYLTEDSDSKDVFDKITQWLSEEERENNIFTAFIGDTHYPHKDRGYGYPQTLVGNYDSEAKYFDDNFKIFWDFFKSSKYYENTMFVIFADHGEELLDHGGLFHGVSLYEELIWVPLNIYVPNLNPKKIDNFVELTDVYLTIYELIGVQLQTTTFRQGKSLMPLINRNGGSYVHKNYISSSRCYHSVDGDYSEYSIIDANSGYKLIYNQMYFTFELFNIFTDPLEKNNLVDSHIEEFNQICQILDLTLNGYEINN